MVAPNSPTRVYNEVLDLIRKDRKLAKLFGNSIVGYGEPSYSRLQRNRSISNKVVLNKNGEKLQEIRFYIEGEKEEHYGVVNAKLIEDQSLKSWRYYHISVDVYKTKKMDEAFEELAGKKDTKLIEAYSNRQNQTSLVTPNLSIDMFSSPEYLKEKQLELQRKRVHSGFFAPKNPKSNNDDGNASWFGIFKPSSRN
ncbi:putative mitochondrial import inner membrane translocase subunit TIM21 [Zancudomyces culisetae]|uniref:Mitochondrial import inner membrane translocase subunit Tim21 n=1 Tax=Zancudomyces culisetae TaxID=1213189 RepID=A0A1R1PFE2_ZANCU|nr:putative mitochondrial import inner membrane translocase subunit TIM21 [Zancudomyces culisetae]|eukprot:OMH79725.1 putative mitochondrial import inner membrane translocase subunit TIM21 [Zancudomyces culisetae]